MPEEKRKKTKKRMLPRKKPEEREWQELPKKQ
jgi:hypothetical protein